MHTRLKKFRAKRHRPPKPIPPPQPPRPSITELRRIYRDLISTDVDQRVETLKKAAHWYDGAVAYIVYYKELNPFQKKAMLKVKRERLTVLTSDTDKIKEQALVAAIQQYEKVVKRLEPPKVNTFLSKYSKVRSVLEKRKRRMNRKFGDFLETVDKILKPVNYKGERISIHVDKLSHTRRINSVGDITFDRKFLDMVRRTTRKSGLLAGMNHILPVFAEAHAQRPELDHKGHRTGRYLVSGRRRAVAWENMFNNLVSHCINSKTNVRLVRRQKDAPSVGKTAA